MTLPLDTLAEPVYSGTYFSVHIHRDSPSGKTKIYRVCTPTATLGFIKWYAPWRRYTFDPMNNTVYEPTCLRELATACEQLTTTHVLERKKVAA